MQRDIIRFDLKIKNQANTLEKNIILNKRIHTEYSSIDCFGLLFIFQYLLL